MNKPRLTVGVYCCNKRASTFRFYRCLQTWEMSFRPVWRDELPGLKPGDVDVLLLPGGWYGIDRVPPQNQHEKEQEESHPAMERAVREHVQAGGGVVGICCGAFNVVWMDLIKAEISRAEGAGLHTMEVVNDRHPITRGVIERVKGRKDRKWRAVPVIRINGPIFFPKDPASMIFSYDWERRLGAVLAGECGRVRAVAISPHPERTAGETTPDERLPVSSDPLMPVAGLLRNSLLWAADRAVG